MNHSLGSIPQGYKALISSELLDDDNRYKLLGACLGIIFW